MLTILVVAAATALTACGSVGSSASDSESSGRTIDVGTGTLDVQKMKNVALLMNNDNSATYTVALVDAANKAAKDNGVKLDVKYAHLDAPTELANYQSVLSSGKYQGMIVQPLTGQLCAPVASDSVAKKLAVVVMVSPLCSTTAKTSDGPWAPGTVSFVGGMNNRAHTVDLLSAAAKNSPGPQKVMLVVGTQTLPDTISFLDGYKDFAANHPDWTLSDTVYTDFSAPDALAKTQNALQGNSDVTMIVTSYAGITDGVVQAIDAQKLQGKIAVYDQTGGNSQSVALIKAGKLTGTLPSYPASIGIASLQALLDAASGPTPPRFIDDDGNPDAAKGAVTQADIASLTPQYK
jgi:ribose transport system substrate-binding protein